MPALSPPFSPEPKAPMQTYAKQKKVIKRLDMELKERGK